MNAQVSPSRIKAIVKGEIVIGRLTQRLAVDRFDHRQVIAHQLERCREDVVVAGAVHVAVAHAGLVELDEFVGILALKVGRQVLQITARALGVDVDRVQPGLFAYCQIDGKVELMRV